METTQYKTYICHNAVELLPNGEAAQCVVWWNISSALPVVLLSKQSKYMLH